MQLRSVLSTSIRMRTGVEFAAAPAYGGRVGETHSKICCRDCALYNPTAVTIATPAFGPNNRIVLPIPGPHNTLTYCSRTKPLDLVVSMSGSLLMEGLMLYPTIQPSRRRSFRIKTPNSVWVCWRCEGRDDISKVHDLSLGGLSLQSEKTRAVGAVTQIDFLVEEGQIVAEALVKWVKLGHGLGMKFTAISERDLPNLICLMKRFTSLSTGICNLKEAAFQKPRV